MTKQNRVSTKKGGIQSCYRILKKREKDGKGRD